MDMLGGVWRNLPRHLHNVLAETSPHQDAMTHGKDCNLRPMSNGECIHSYNGAVALLRPAARSQQQQ